MTAPIVLHYSRTPHRRIDLEGVDVGAIVARIQGVANPISGQLWERAAEREPSGTHVPDAYFGRPDGIMRGPLALNVHHYSGHPVLSRRASGVIQGEGK